MASIFDSTDPFRPLLSLADQKSLLVREKLGEKKVAAAESPLLQTALDSRAARERLLSGEAGLLEIAQSSLFRSRENIFDLISGNEQTSSAVQEYADYKAGITPEDRQRLVTSDQEKVTQSLAGGDYLGALGNALLAAPGTLADSANVIPEIAAGAAATALTGGIAAPIAGAAIFGRRAKKAIDTGSKIAKAVKLAKASMKTAGQMSIVTAQMTQTQVNDFREKHGENPTTSRIAGMYALNLSTMMLQGTILKQLFIPKFKSEIVKEVKTVVKNMGKGSNFVQLGKRIGSGAMKAVAAGGAEAGQEYLQTWAEIINVEIGPKDSGKFFEAMSREIGDKDNKLQALVGGFLGAGAGGLARVSISAPAIAAGGALDLTKATAKGVAKTTIGTAKLVTRIAQKQTSKASLKVLSEEERAVLRKTHETESVVAQEKTADIDRKIEIVKDAIIITDMHKDEGLKALVDEVQRDRGLTTADLDDQKKFNAFKDDVLSKFRAQKTVLEETVRLSNIGRIIKKSGENVVDKSVAAAQAVLEDIPIEELITKAKKSVVDFSDQAVEAVKELRSSTARGMVDLGLKEGIASIKTLKKAAEALDLDELQRVTAILAQKDTKLGAALEKVVKKKKAAQEWFSQRNANLTTEETLSETISNVAKTQKLTNDQAASVASALQKTLAGKIGDLASLEAIESVMNTYKESSAYRNKIPGALDAVTIEVLERKLKKASDRIRKPRRVEAKAEMDKVVAEIQKKGLIEYFKESGAVKKAAELLEAANTSEFMTKLKKKIPDMPDLPDLSTEEGIVEFENTVEKHFNKAVKVVKETVVGPERVKRKVEPGKLRDKLALAATALKGEGADVALSLADKLIVELDAAGYDTQEDLADLLAEFPEFAENEEFSAKLLEAFPSPMVMSEESDNVPMKETSTDEEIDKQYLEDNPGCALK